MSPESYTGSHEIKEAHLLPFFDAIHVIEYEVEGEGKNRKPNEWGLQAIDATANLLELGLSKNVIISGVHYKTKNPFEPRISALYATQLRIKLRERGIENINVIAEARELSERDVEKGAKDTGGDVKFLLTQAEKRGWRRVLVVAHRPHILRIQTLLERRGFTKESRTRLINYENGLGIITRSSQTILRQADPNFSLSAEAIEKNRQFSKAEKKKLKTMILDRQGNLASFVAHVIPQDLKAKLQS